MTRRNANKTLQGIKTAAGLYPHPSSLHCRNANKTLQGIKTLDIISDIDITVVSKR